MSTVTLDGVSCRRAGREVLHGVDLELVPGELLALVGPNGAGKSTILGVACGDLPTSTGSVTLDGRPLAGWSAGDLARRRSVLLQHNEVSFAFTVREVIEMGRNPWRDRATTQDDDEAVGEAVARSDTGHLLDRPFSTLSGGERARVSLARVLAQQTPVVMLDEPTAALDLGHQEEVMQVAAELAREGRTVAVVLHDLSLAAAYADRVAVVADGTVSAVGTPGEVLHPDLIAAVYGVSTHRLTTPDGHIVIVPARPQIPSTTQPTAPPQERP